MEFVSPTNGTMAFYEEAWYRAVGTYDHYTFVTVMTFLIHEVVYFARYVPFYILEMIPSMSKYKIQADKTVTNEMRWRALKGLFFNHIFVQLPAMMLFHPGAHYLGMKPLDAPLPHWYEVVLLTVVFLVIEDFWEYWLHRLLHWGPFYRYIHKQHHEFQAPFGIVGEYAHPAETVILGTGTVLGPLLFAKQLHVVTLWWYLVARLLQVVDAHSGYDFPWSLRHFLPFWAGADFHDHHHMNFIGNYATSFRWCDWLFGTDKYYVRYKAALAEKDAEKKSL